MRDLQYMIDVMTAARDGKKIEVNVGRGWEGTDEPAWNWGYGPNGIDYRIAPEPRKTREFVVIRCKLNGTLMVRDAEDKRFCRTPECEYINVREVLSEDK
jgi:hypothetical protein